MFGHGSQASRAVFLTIEVEIADDYSIQDRPG